MADQNPNSRTDIPHSLIYQEILLKLPPKSLIRFKCVARKWNSDISSVEFAKTYLQCRSNLSSSFVLTHDENLLFEAFESDGEYVLDFNRFDINTRGPRFLVSSCNGLALLISWDQSVDKLLELPYNLHLVDFAYLVYNPILGANHFIEIPHQNDHQLYLGDDPSKGDTKYNFGFGYVSSRDDYYIVSMHLTHSSEVVSHVYSMRSQKWRSYAEDIIVKQQVAPMAMEFRSIWHEENATVVAETLHWGIIIGVSSQYILAYDLNVLDKHTVIPLPETNFACYFGLCCVNDYLCAWARKEHGDVEMWMMKEYKVWNSWTMLFRFQSDSFTCHKFIGSINPKMVLAIANGDEVILVDFSYDLPIISNTVLWSKSQAVSYIPSLVSVFDLLSEPRE